MCFAYFPISDIAVCIMPALILLITLYSVVFCLVVSFLITIVIVGGSRSEHPSEVTEGQGVSTGGYVVNQTSSHMLQSCPTSPPHGKPHLVRENRTHIHKGLCSFAKQKNSKCLKFINYCLLTLHDSIGCKIQNSKIKSYYIVSHCIVRLYHMVNNRGDENSISNYSEYPW